MVAVLIAVMISITGLNLLISSFVSFFRKSSMVDTRDIWEALSTATHWAVGFVSEHLFKRKVALPEIDFRRLRATSRFWRRVAVVASILLVVIYLGSSIAIVNPDEIGVRFRFGAIVDARLEPGPHFALPWPFEEIRKVKASRVYRVEVGFRTDPSLLKSVSALLWEATHQVPGYTKLNRESVTLTGDENLVDLNIVVQYRPARPRDLFLSH